MRLFVAADLSDIQRAELRTFVAEAQEAAPFEYIRWIPEENWHATLAFIGDKEDSDLDGLKQTIEKCLVEKPVLLGKPIRIQPFPHRDRPRLLAFKIDPSNLIQKVQWNLSKALQIKDGERGFRMHITVARFRELPSEEVPVLNQSLKNLTTSPSDTWQFPSVTLYASILKQSGAEYQSLCRWTL